MESQLAQIIIDAYDCKHKHECHAITPYGTWQMNPSRGHAPRGYCGAYVHLSDIELVLVLAEPGDPGLDEIYPTDPKEAFRHHVETVDFVGGDLFHKNVRRFLKMCYGNETDVCDLNRDDLKEIFKHVWITETVLCSAKPSGGPINRLIVDNCGHYLKRQHELFKNAFWVSMGTKAQKRLCQLGIACQNDQKHMNTYHPRARIDKNVLFEDWKRVACAFKEWKESNRFIAPAI